MSTISATLSSSTFEISHRTLSGFPQRLSHWFELLQAAKLKSSKVTQSIPLNMPMQLSELKRPPCAIVEYNDGYAIGSYNGDIIYTLPSIDMPLTENTRIENVVTCSLQGAPVTAIAATSTLIGGFRNGEISVNDQLRFKLDPPSFSTSLCIAGPERYELVAIGTSTGLVLIYDICKGTTVHSVSVKPRDLRDICMCTTHVAIAMHLGCICAACENCITAIDARVNRQTPCIELHLKNQDVPTSMETITAMATLPWGGVVVGSRSSSLRLLDLASVNPAECISTALCHPNPIKMISACADTLISGSARRLVRHKVSERKIITRSYKELDSVLCGLCPSAAVLFDRSIIGTPVAKLRDFSDDNMF